MVRSTQNKYDTCDSQARKFARRIPEAQTRSSLRREERWDRCLRVLVSHTSHAKIPGRKEGMHGCIFPVQSTVVVLYLACAIVVSDEYMPSSDVLGVSLFVCLKLSKTPQVGCDEVDKVRRN